MADVPLITLPLIRYIAANPGCTATEAMWLGEFESNRVAPASLISAMVSAGLITESVERDAIRYTLTTAGYNLNKTDQIHMSDLEPEYFHRADTAAAAVNLERASAGAQPDGDDRQPHTHQRAREVTFKSPRWIPRGWLRSDQGWRR